jgi:hypothetical protein
MRELLQKPYPAPLSSEFPVDRGHPRLTFYERRKLLLSMALRHQGAWHPADRSPEAVTSPDPASRQMSDPVQKRQHLHTTGIQRRGSPRFLMFHVITD